MNNTPPVGKRWVAGQSGNPSGRRRGIASRVRRLTGNGKTLVTFLVDTVADTTQKQRDRLEACKLLLERGWGRPSPALDELLRAEADAPALEAMRALHALAPSSPGRVYDCE